MANEPTTVLVVGGGAAGVATAATLLRESAELGTGPRSPAPVPVSP